MPFWEKVKRFFSGKDTSEKTEPEKGDLEAEVEVVGIDSEPDIEVEVVEVEDESDLTSADDDIEVEIVETEDSGAFEEPAVPADAVRSGGKEPLELGENPDLPDISEQSRMTEEYKAFLESQDSVSEKQPDETADEPAEETKE